MTLEELAALRKKAGGMHTLLGMQDARLDEQGRVCVSMRVTKDLLNPHGIAHGGAIFSLCDSAAGAHASLKKTLPVTSEGSIHYYRPAMPDTLLTATAIERKDGKTISVVLVETRDDEGRHIADAVFSMFYQNARTDS